MAIEWIGYRVVKYDEIEFPRGVGGAGESLAARKKSGDVVALSASMDPERGTNGPINAPVLRVGSNAEGKKYRLVSGLDRIAAQMVEGKDRGECRLCKGDDDELRRATLDENLRRRRADDWDKMAVERVALEEARIIKEQEEARVAAEVEAKEKLARSNAVAGKGGGKAKKEKRLRGRPESAKGKARKTVAKQLGTTPEALRQAGKRVASEGKPAKPPAPLGPPVETFGLDVSPKPFEQEFSRIRNIQAVVDAAEKTLKATERDIKSLKDMGPVGVATYNRIHGEITNALTAVLRASPDAVCPYCKDPVDMNGRRKACGGCSGTGYVCKDALVGIDKLLKRPAPGLMIPDGQGGFKSIDATGLVIVIEPRAPEGKRKITVEGIDPAVMAAAAESEK